MNTQFNTDPCARGRAHAAVRSSAAFTMIEIAISLAIIGFALVAIIGILPMGMNAQRDNRQETIVNQDASILMDAVRNGERGLDDLTNYVIAITNYVTDYKPNGSRGPTTISAFTTQSGYLRNGSASPLLALTNGYTIIGLLSTPKIVPNGLGFTSNHVVAVFRSMSGPATEKPPQLNSTMQELALDYRIVADNSGYSTNFFDPSWTNYGIANLSTNDIALRSNYMAVVRSFQTNLHDVRLTFLWPVLPSGKLGSGRQVYRTMVAGRYTNDPPNSPYFFYQPRTFF